MGICAGCFNSADCPPGEECNAGSCQAAPEQAKKASAKKKAGKKKPPQSSGCEIVPVYFEFDSSEVGAEAMAILDRLAPCLADGNSHTVLGRTDSAGDEDYNLVLGLSRAVAVVEYLVGKGVPSDKLVAATAGERDADEGSPGTDRRVDIL